MRVATEICGSVKSEKIDDFESGYRSDTDVRKYLRSDELMRRASTALSAPSTSAATHDDFDDDPNVERHMMLLDTIEEKRPRIGDMFMNNNTNCTININIS